MLIYPLLNFFSFALLITHDNGIARKAQRIIRLFDGKIIYDGPSDNEAAVVNPDIPHGEHEKKEDDRK